MSKKAWLLIWISLVLKKPGLIWWPFLLDKTFIPHHRANSGLCWWIPCLWGCRVWRGDNGWGGYDAVRSFDIDHVVVAPSNNHSMTSPDGGASHAPCHHVATTPSTGYEVHPGGAGPRGRRRDLALERGERCVLTSACVQPCNTGNFARIRILGLSAYVSGTSSSRWSVWENCWPKTIPIRNSSNIDNVFKKMWLLGS